MRQQEMLERPVSAMTCSDLDELTGLLPGASFTLLPIGGGLFRAQVLSCQLHDVSLWIGRSTPFLAFGDIAPERMHLLLPLSGQEQMILNGRRTERQDIAVVQAGGPLDCASHGEVEWAAIMMPTDTARRMLLPSRRSRTLAAGRQYLLRTDPAAWDAAASLLRSAREIFLKEPAIFDASEPRQALRDSLLAALRDLLVGPNRVAPARRLPISRSRRRLIDRCEAFMTAHPGRATSLAALSDGVAIPAARLRAAYLASFGMDPALFLTLRRLALVRSELKSCAEQERSVWDVARSYGFSQLADFAHDYSWAFGELVSEDDTGQTTSAMT
jgi:AraC-like DNA-binding protein